MAHHRAALAALVLLLAPAAAAAQPKPPVPSMLVWTPEQQLKWYPAIETVYPVRTVPRGPKVRALSKAGHEIAVAWTDAGGKAWTLDSYMAAYRTTGVIVLQDGKVVLERYALGRKPTDRWTSMSVAKSVTSLLAGAAIQDGKLKLDDPVERFVPELKGSGYDGVTVRQILMMSSGVRWNEAYEDPNSDLARMGPAGGKREGPSLEDPRQPAARARARLDLPLQHRRDPPGRAGGLTRGGQVAGRLPFGEDLEALRHGG
jgi:CubicO group peptidase (beta-lactamase class C family)